MQPRYFAICRPLSPLSRSSTGQAKKMIAWIWLISFMSALPWAFYTKVYYLLYDGKIVEESAWCSIPFTEETRGSLYFMLASTLLYFIAPLVVVSFIYSRHIATTFSLIYLLFLLLRIGLALTATYAGHELKNLFLLQIH